MFGKFVLRTALVAASLMAVSAVSAQQYVYPAKGQSPQKQKSDEAACYQWAVQQSGFDPAKAPPAPAEQPGVQRGTRLRGAAAGATVGAITDNDRSDAALAGAVGAASAQRGQKRQAARAQSAQTGEQQASFQKARGVCLEGRGYTVK
jgi:hypothetical protein